MEFNAQKRNSKWDREHGNYLFTNEGDTTKGVLKLQTQYATVTDPGDAGTITPPADTPVFLCSIVTAGAETRVLGAPDHFGQKAIITFGTDGGNFTMTNASGWLDGGVADDVVTFGDAGDTMIVEAHGTAATDWRVTSEKGVAFA
jgi:hypothetical protein